MARERLETSLKPEKLPANISVVETSLLDSHKALCESGVFEFLKDLSASVGGSEIDFVVVPEDKDIETVGSASMGFTFARRDYVPRIMDREPWQVWYRCEARSQNDSNTVDLVIKQVSSEKGEQSQTYRSASWKDGGWQNLEDFAESAQKLTNALYPKTGIDRSLYDEFNGDLMVAVAMAGNDWVAYKRLTDQVLNYHKYRPIVRMHMSFRRFGRVKR